MHFLKLYSINEDLIWFDYLPKTETWVYLKTLECCFSTGKNLLRKSSRIRDFVYRLHADKKIFKQLFCFSMSY